MLFQLRKLDWSLVIVVLLLSGVGLFTIQSIGSNESSSLFKKQIIFLALGLLVMFTLSFFDYRVFRNYSFVLIAVYLFFFLLLILVLFSPEVRGAASWFHLGPLRFEPIEFFKIVIILILAKYFSLRHIEMYRIRHLIVSGIYVGLPALIVLAQPDFGSALILLSIWFGLTIVAGIKLRHLLILTLIMLMLFAVGWFGLLKDYQKQRILTFLNPEDDPLGRGYHISQSLIAVGSGGWLGQEAEGSSQAGLKFLPEQHTDFIFATLAEKEGLLGVGFLLILFAIFLWRIIKIALISSNNFARLFVIGFAIMIFSQLIINIGMNMALLPITGLTLPLVSYGGSSLVSMFFGLGILQSIKIRN